MLVTVLVFVVVLVIGILLEHEVRSTSISIMPIVVPAPLAEAGLSSDVLTSVVAIEMERLDRLSRTRNQSGILDYSSAELKIRPPAIARTRDELSEIKVPGQDMSLSSVARSLRSLIGIEDVAVQVVVTPGAQGYSAHIRVYGGPYSGEKLLPASELVGDMTVFGAKLARGVFSVVSPYSAAISDVVTEELSCAAEKRGCDYQRGFQALARVAADPPHQDDKWGEVGQAYVHLKSGNYDEAIRSSERALKLDGSFEMAYINLGSAFMGKKEHAEAAKQFEKAVQLERNDARAYYNWGNAFRALESDRAFTAYREAARKAKPDDIALRLNIYNNWGYALLNRRRYADAEAKLVIAASLSPRDDYVNSNLGDALVGLGRHRAAIERYRDGVEFGTDRRDILPRWAEALKALEASGAVAQEGGALHEELGMAFARFGLHSAAVVHLTKSIHFVKASGGRPAARTYTRLAESFDQLGKPEEARATRAEANGSR